MPSVNLLPHQINLAAKTTTNVSGGQAVTYATSYKNVAAFVTDASASLQLIYARRDILIDHTIYITGAVTVNTGDVVVFGAKTFFIRGKLDPSGTGRVYELHCLEVQPGTIVIEM